MQRVYEYEQTCLACGKEIQDIKKRKVLQKESDRVAGPQMPELSRTGPARHRVDQPELTLQPPSAGFLSGTESMLEDREERRKAEEERHAREDAIRREQALDGERQTQALLETIRMQTESAKRLIQQASGECGEINTAGNG